MPLKFYYKVETGGLGDPLFIVVLSSSSSVPVNKMQAVSQWIQIINSYSILWFLMWGKTTSFIL